MASVVCYSYFTALSQQLESHVKEMEQFNLIGYFELQNAKSGQ